MNEGLINAGKSVIQNRLLVEGTDDVGVCYHLLTCSGINVAETVEIKSKNGINPLLSSLKIELMSSGINNLGIVVDADENLANRWRALVQILEGCQYREVPIEPASSGTIVREKDKPTVGIWIMPDNKLPGMLEHFCRFLIPPHDVLWDLAGDVVKQVIETNRLFPEGYEVKAHMHTWLAWQKEPGKPMGQAITKSFLDHSTPQAQEFVGWMCKLFEVSNDIYTSAS